MRKFLQCWKSARQPRRTRFSRRRKIFAKCWSLLARVAREHGESMNVTCKDRDRIFEDGSAAEWAALENHAATCMSCAEELRSWKSLSTTAAELRDYSDSPTLWPRIHQALAEEAAATAQQRERWSWRSLFPNLSISWQTATARKSKDSGKESASSNALAAGLLQRLLRQALDEFAARVSGCPSSRAIPLLLC